jgi:hypothetical protein
MDRPAPVPATGSRPRARHGRVRDRYLRQCGSHLACERVEREDRNVRRRLSGRRAYQRIQGLEENVPRRHESDAGDFETHRLHAPPRRQEDRVADLRLERRRQLLVEDDAALLEPAVQKPDCVESSGVVRRDGENRARPGTDGADAGRHVLDARERRRRDRLSGENAGLPRDILRDAL